MKRRLTIGAALAAFALAGCGGDGGAKAQKGDEAALRAALVEYLRVNSMDMKPDKFESIEVNDAQATAKVRMAPKDDTYGLKPLWAVTFNKSEGRWQVTDVKR